MSLLVKPGAPESDGTLVRITPESAGWEHVGFEVLALDGAARRETGTRECCVVVVSGTCDVSSEHGEWSELGGREDPFSGLPDAAYLPPGSAFEVSGDAEVAPHPVLGADVHATGDHDDAQLARARAPLDALPGRERHGLEAHVGPARRLRGDLDDRPLGGRGGAAQQAGHGVLR